MSTVSTTRSNLDVRVLQDNTPSVDVVSTSRSNLDVRADLGGPSYLPCPPDCGATTQGGADDFYREPANVQMGYAVPQKALMQTVFSADNIGSKQELMDEQSKSSENKKNWLLIAVVVVIGYVVYKYA